MKKAVFWIVVGLLFGSTHLLDRSALAVESERELGVSKPRNIAKVIKPADVSKTESKKIKKITVLVTSSLPLFGQTAEDLLAAKLRDMGFDVVEKTRVSEATLHELSRFEKQEEKQQEEILDVIKIGEKLGLDAVIIGTLFDGRCQLSFPEENPPRLIEKTVVSTFYLQIVDVRNTKTILSLILEYDRGENISNAIDIMAKIVKEEMTY